MGLNNLKMTPVAVYEFQNHPIELFGEPENLLWRKRTFLELLGRYKKSVAEADLIGVHYCVDFANNRCCGDERFVIGRFLNWLQHDAAYRLKKVGAYSALDDKYHEELSGISTDYGFMHFAGTFRHPAWSWSSVMGVFDFDTKHCPKLLENGDDIKHDTLMQMHFILAENPQYANNEDIFETVAHIQERCALFIKHNVLKGILPLLASQGRAMN